MAAEPEEPPDLLAEIEHLIDQLQNRHGATVRDQATRLLEDIDAVHRAGLSHLMDVIRGMGGDAFVNRLIGDPAIRMLLMSYDLVPVDRRLMAEEALDMVRGHLHAHGVDVEILEVVGGVVYVRIHGLSATTLENTAVVHDLEEALRAGFVGFQELVTKERTNEPKPIPIGGIRRPHRPVYRDVLDTDTLRDGQMKAVDVDGTSVLIVRAAEGYYAVAKSMWDSPLPLEYSALAGSQLTCSWHGCRYDVRTGSRLDGMDGRLRVFPVRVEDDKIRIAADVEALPRGAGMNPRTLIAGFGNVLRGDDGFGVEVVRRLQVDENQPEGVEMLEVGTGGIALAQALLTPYERLVIVDAMKRGGQPGTVYVLRVESVDVLRSVDMHMAVPSKALGLAQAIGVLPPYIFMVGCEPAGVDELDMTLSPPVQDAVDYAVQEIRRLLAEDAA